MTDQRPKYSSVFITLKPNVQTTIQVIFDPPIDNPPKVILSSEPDNGYYEIKRVKTNDRT